MTTGGIEYSEMEIELNYPEVSMFLSRTLSSSKFSVSHEISLVPFVISGSVVTG